MWHNAGMGDVAAQAKLIADRMVTAREMAELSIGQAVHNSPISADRLKEIEAGAVPPGSADIATVAAATGLPVGWFLRDREQLVASRKPAPEGGVSPKFDLQLERLTVHVEQLAEDGIIVPSARPGFRLDDDHDIIARRAAEVRGWGDAADQPIRNLTAFCERVGLLVFSQPFVGSPFEGAVTEIETSRGLQFGLALVDQNAGLLRSRFTLAHELGHWVYRTSFEAGCGLGAVERSMNSFAAHLLMPSSYVERLAVKFTEARSLAIAVSALCGVSWTATIGHLANLHFVSDEEYTLVLQRKPGVQEYRDAGFDVPMVEGLSTVPPQYRDSVLSAYRERRLTTGKAVEVLLGSIGEDQLPERIPPRGRQAS